MRGLACREKYGYRLEHSQANERAVKKNKTRTRIVNMDVGLHLH